MRTREALGIAFLSLAAFVPTAMGADHLDGTTTGSSGLFQPDASSDITDVFAWMSDASTVTLVMDVFPGATTSSKFSNAVKYVFHTNSLTTYGGTAVKRDVICTFDTSQTASCWVVNPADASVADYVTGNASTASAPITSADAKVKVFAGLRDDPFFFNLAGFRNTTSTVAAAIKAYVGGNMTYISGFDATWAKCPTLTSAAKSALATYVMSDCTGAAAAKDFFRKPETGVTDCTTSGKPALVTTGSANEGTTGNILAIVVNVDKSLLTAGGPIISVWGATTK